MFILLTLFLIFLLYTVCPIPVDNTVEGDPHIECGPNTINVIFNVRKQFEGHVFVKGLFDVDECRTDGNGKLVCFYIAQCIVTLT